MRFGKANAVQALLTCWFLSGLILMAQAPKYNLGHTPTSEESRAMGYTYDLFGKDLPAGSGTVIDGAKLFALKCAVCHGAQAKAPKPRQC